MAIQKFDNKENVGQSQFIGIFLGLSNGDLNALQDVVRIWNFRDEETFLRFVIALMIKSSGNKKIYIEDNAGNKIAILPNDELLQSHS